MGEEVRMGKQEDRDRATDRPRHATLWKDMLPFVVLVVFGVTCLCGRPVGEKASSPQSLVLLMMLTAAIATGLFAARASIADRWFPNGAPSALYARALTDVTIVVLLSVFIPMVDQYFYPVEHTARDLLQAIAYHAVIVFSFGTVCRLRRMEPVSERAPPTAVLLAEAAQAGNAFDTSLETPHYAEAEGHYVKLVFTDRVEHRRARFRDVVKDLGQAGLQVQKSFWVKRDAVAAMRRVGRQLYIVLTCGSEIPVGRANERHVLSAFPSLQGRSRS